MDILNDFEKRRVVDSAEHVTPLTMQNTMFTKLEAFTDPEPDPSPSACRYNNVDVHN